MTTWSLSSVSRTARTFPFDKLQLSARLVRALCWLYRNTQQEYIMTTLFDQNGIVVRVDLENDLDSNPNEFDCYDAADIAAWKRDDWCFVTVVATVELHGAVIRRCYISV